MSITACASAPENPWADFEADEREAVRPIDCGQFPLPSDFSDAGATFDAGGVSELEEYRVCSEHNEQLADTHADQVDQLREARNELVQAGAHQRNIADMRAEMLEDERRHHFWQSVGYWILIVGAITL